jgi:basic amino acid/polyamine antiporter, APA family
VAPLARSIGLPHATALVVGIIIGASIFVQPSEVTRHVPGFGGMLAVWLLAGALTWCGALVCAELASAFPHSGGVYVFLRELFAPAVGFLWGWAMFWSMHSGIIAAIATVFARYSITLAGLDDRAVNSVAIAGILSLSAVNYVGVRPGSAFQLAVTLVKVVAIGALAALLLGWCGLHGRALQPPAAVPASRELLLGVVAGLFAFGGWHMVTYSAGETRDAPRTIPRALMIGTGVVTAAYIALNAAYLLVLPVDRILASPRVAADAVAVVAGPRAATAIAAMVAISAFGAMNGIILAGPRVYLAMADDRLLFRWLGSVHPTFRTPHVAIAAQAIVSSLLVLTGSYRTLFTRVVYTEWIFFGALALGLLRVRRRSHYAPAFRIPGGAVLPVTFAAACAVIVVNQIAAEPRQSAIGLAIVLAGLPVYLVWTHARDRFS